MSAAPLLTRIDANGFVGRGRGADFPADLLARAAEIVTDVRTSGDAALRRHAEQLDGLTPEAPLIVPRSQLDAALDALPAAQRPVLERTAARIRRFAEAQRDCLAALTLELDHGGSAGHVLRPVRAAGCYAPGGRYPLPSSVLMTAVTARAAGVEQVWVASPRPTLVTLAAAAIAGADGLLAAGGAQAIAALAYGTESVPQCDAVVGPGNRWVTAAKKLVAGDVAIDMLAGPSEVLILADETANAAQVAANLLAQAEHDVDAVVHLATTHAPLLDEVERELAGQLETLPTAAVTRAALAASGALHVATREDLAAISDRIAPEHLELHVRDPRALLDQLRHFGAAFLGGRTPTPLGDYGAGPNHTLPTGGAARCASGLSVFTFLRTPTWLCCDGDDDATLRSDAIALARMEGLEGHARSLERTGRH